MLRLVDICIQKPMSMQGFYTVWFKSHLSGPAYCQKEAAVQNPSDQTNQFAVAKHKSPGLFGIQELESLEITRKAFMVLVQLELSVKDEPVLLMEELRQSWILVGIFNIHIDNIHIFYSAMCT